MAGNESATANSAAAPPRRSRRSTRPPNRLATADTGTLRWDWYDMRFDGWPAAVSFGELEVMFVIRGHRAPGIEAAMHAAEFEGWVRRNPGPFDDLTGRSADPDCAVQVHILTDGHVDVCIERASGRRLIAMTRAAPGRFLLVA